MDDLPLEVGEIDRVAVGDGDVTDPARGEIEQGARSEPAGAHHERLDGGGYPRGLRREEIPLQSRAMAIADVFDALTAQDRPYKAAVPLDRSLAILEAAGREGHLDAELLELFIRARVYERAVPSR